MGSAISKPAEPAAAPAAAPVAAPAAAPVAAPVAAPGEEVPVAPAMNNNVRQNAVPAENDEEEQEPSSQLIGGANKNKNKSKKNKKLLNSMNSKMINAMKELEKAAKNYEKTIKNMNKNKNKMSPSKEFLMNTRAKKAMKSAEFNKAYANMCMSGECPNMPESCSEGEILRNGYVAHKKTGNVMVMPSCIENRGKPGKQGPQIILRNDEDLKVFGYENVKDLSKRKRQSALKKAVKELGAEVVIQRLRALIALRAGGTDPEGRAIFEEDRDWVYSHFPANYKTEKAREKQMKVIEETKNKEKKNKNKM